MIAPWVDANDLDSSDPQVAQDAVEAASFVLWMLSARKYGGLRTVTEIYCQTGLSHLGSTVLPTTMRASLMSGSGMQVFPMLREGVLTNEVFGACHTCGCEHTIRLRGGPVRSVTAMWHGERPVPLGDVAIYDYSYLTAPNRCWGTCEDLEVTYTYGTPPPTLGKMAARDLANQYVLAMSDDEECVLPQRVTQISRQGVSWTLLDPQDFLDNGRTGLYTVDLFLRTVNPDRARLRARVFSPDLHRARAYHLAKTDVVQPPHPQQMAVTPAPQPMMTQTSGGAATQVYTGQPLRWVVPGASTAGSPPVLTVQPSGAQIPPESLVWRSGNYTLDLTAGQVEQLLPPGSSLVVSTTTSQTSHPVERRTL